MSSLTVLPATLARRGVPNNSNIKGFAFGFGFGEGSESGFSQTFGKQNGKRNGGVYKLIISLLEIGESTATN